MMAGWRPPTHSICWWMQYVRSGERRGIGRSVPFLCDGDVIQDYDVMAQIKQVVLT